MPIATAATVETTTSSDVLLEQARELGAMRRARSAAAAVMSRADRQRPAQREQHRHARVARPGDIAGASHATSRARVEHADAVGQRERFAHVVRHDDDGLLHAFLNPPELARAARRA